MNRRIFWVLVILVIGIFPLNLFSVITSRIEGTVLDESTGQPIVGAEVFLLYDSSVYNYKKGGREWVKRTDSRGFFQYNDLFAGEYYIAIYKEGYELYGPCTKEELKGERDVPNFFGGTIALIPRSVKGRIYLKEGEIKHFKISLRKEAIVEVIFTMKTEKGETPLVTRDIRGKVDLKNPFYAAAISLIEAEIHGAENEKILGPSIVDIGKVIFLNLSGEQKVKIAYGACFYPLVMKEIYLRSGETTTIQHVLDFTAGMVIHGLIAPKDPDKAFYISSVSLEGSGYRIPVKGIIEENGEFWLKGMEEGKCLLKIKIVKRGNARWEEIKDEIVLDLKKNERIELDLNY
jgi:hypothetical protein